MNSFFKRGACAAAAFVMASSPAWADTYHVTLGGVFDATAPVTAFSRPGAVWSMDFDIDSNPTPIPLPDSPLEGLNTVVPFSNSDYRLDGVAGLQPVYLVLYSAAALGGISLFFDVTFSEPFVYEALETFGDALYSGSEFSPTIEPGVYASYFPGDASASSVQIASGGVLYGQGHTVISVVPEPATGLMWLAGSLVLGAAARRRVAMQHA